MFYLLTLQQVVGGLVLHLRAELPGFLQVLQNKDVGGKVDHVLLPTAKGQPQQFVQVIQGWAHHVACWSTRTDKKNKKKQNQPCQLCRSEREPFVTVSVTDHERRGLFGPGNRVVRDPQSEGFIVVLVRVLLPPDLKLPDRTPSCRKPYVTHLREQEKKKNVVIWSLKTNVH